MNIRNAPFLLTLVSTLAVVQSEIRAAKLPNIVIIMADDLGYGDVQAINPASKIPTPHLDRMASAGMSFTDAHSPSAVCTPTRYGLVTGRYCWRSRLKRGVLNGYGEPLIEKDRPTVASLLKQGVLGGYSPALIEPDRVTIATKLQASGYHTAAVGKWHLGMNMPRKKGQMPESDDWTGDGNVNFGGIITEGPTARGFDYYFGVSGSLDMPPYVWIENDCFTSVPTQEQSDVGFPMFVRRGPLARNHSLRDGGLNGSFRGTRSEGLLQDRADHRYPESHRHPESLL